MNNMNINTIIYCRKSTMSLRENDMSLDSQEFEIKNRIIADGLRVFKVIKDIGSAFNKPQTDLKNILKGCKNKTLAVYDASRLSRNVNNFKEIYKICQKNKHNILIVSLNLLCDYRVSSNYDILLKLIIQTQQESIDLGKRISRSIRYKKSMEAEWGFERCSATNEIVPNEREIKITKLIILLGKNGSYVNEIKKIVEEVRTITDVEPFEIIEYDDKGNEETIFDRLPYGMNCANIEETLKVYGIKRRKARWHSKDIFNILMNVMSSSLRKILDDMNNSETESVLSSGLNNLEINENVSVEEISASPENKIEWISIYYDPAIGLPPNIVLPEGMALPTVKTMLYLPNRV